MFEKIKDMIARAIFKHPVYKKGPPFGCPTCGKFRLRYDTIELSEENNQERSIIMTGKCLDCYHKFKNTLNLRRISGETMERIKFPWEDE